jgi:hypothetical protein
VVLVCLVGIHNRGRQDLHQAAAVPLGRFVEFFQTQVALPVAIMLVDGATRVVVIPHHLWSLGTSSSSGLGASNILGPWCE